LLTAEAESRHESGICVTKQGLGNEGGGERKSVLNSGFWILNSIEYKPGMG